MKLVKAESKWCLQKLRVGRIGEILFNGINLQLVDNFCRSNIQYCEIDNNIIIIKLVNILHPNFSHQKRNDNYVTW